MAFFSKSIGDLDWHYIEALLDDGATETVRLEFKREVPAKDETLKRVCSFANTFGGYIAIGAEEEDQKLVGLPGVPPESRLDQKVVQWCFEGIYPLVVPSVSDPIPLDGG
jgi:predicted HTH transcriptional regulator